MEEKKNKIWAKWLLILLSMQILNSGISFPYYFSFASSSFLDTAKNDADLSDVLSDFFDLEKQNSNSQKEVPIDFDQLSIEEETEQVDLLNFKRDSHFVYFFRPGYILYDKTAASLYQPELNTPPPKWA